jgi:hypothetical protein
VHLLNFGDKVLRIEEKASGSSTRKHSFVIEQN